MLTLEVNLHCYNLADSSVALKKHCPLEEHPTPGLSGEEAAEPHSMCSLLRLWLSVCGTRGHVSEVPELTLRLAGLRSSLNHHQLVGAVRALLEVTAGCSVCTELASPGSSWSHHDAPEPDHMQVMCLYTHPKAHRLPFVYLSGFALIVAPVPESTWSGLENKGFTQGLETALKVQRR